MRPRAVSKGSAALAIVLVGCVNTTDEGSGLRIDVLPIPRLIRGDSARVHAQLMARDGRPIPNARFVYSSGDNTIAVVSNDGLVIGVNPGATNVAVQSVGTERTPVVEGRVSVSGTVSLDSLRPVAARWGQTLSLYGSGLAPDSAQVVTINDVPVTIESYRAADSLHPERFGVLQVVAAPPLESNGAGTNASVLVVTSRGAAALSTPLAIDSVDIFWPNSLTPADLGTITGRREFPGLALEAPYWTDWFSFTTATAGDWTFWGGISAVLPAGGVEAEQLQSTPGSPSFIAYYPGRGSSTGQVMLCQGRGVWRSVPWWLSGQVTSEGYASDSYITSFTLRNLPAGRHDLIVTLRAVEAVAPNDASPRGGPTPQPLPHRRANEWALVALPLSEPFRAERYDLVIEPGAGGDVMARDAYEPNDFCEEASFPLLTLGSTGFTDSVVNLTFDRSGDIDWFRIVAQTGGVLHMRAPYDHLENTLYVQGEMASSDLDSAVVVGHLSASDIWCGGGWPDMYLVSYGPDGCEVEGASLQTGAYHLMVGNKGYPGPGAYQLVVTWAPGILPVAPRTAQGRR